MAKLSSDGTYVTVEKGDTLSEIARDYGNGKTYKQLAAINNISNPNLIYVGQIIKLSSSGSSTSKKTTNTNKATVDHFGLQSNADNTLFATWTWSKKNTESYKVLWTYDSGDGVWFTGNNSTNTVDEDSPNSAKQSAYSIPSNAKRVQFKVKPISKTYTKNKKETKYWEAEWSTVKTFNVDKSSPPSVPGTPSVEIEKYKLTTEVNGLDDLNGHRVQFCVIKDNRSTYRSGTVTIRTGRASWSCTVVASGQYKVKCRTYRNGIYSDWSEYSNNYTTIPAAPTSIKTVRASSETSVYLEWNAVATADSYTLQYTTKKEYFAGSDQLTDVTGIETTQYEKTGLESGTEYFFRLRAHNEEGDSEWTDIRSVTIGKDPAAPTTWSSSTTVITGEELILYWVHNSEDGSSQTFAELELTINNVTLEPAYTIKNFTDEDSKDKTRYCIIDTLKGAVKWTDDEGDHESSITADFREGTTIKWRVKTAGITLNYGDWSVQRTVDIYAPPTLELSMTDIDDVAIETLQAFPFKVFGIPGPSTQQPTGYHLSIVSNEIYETVDNIGNVKMVNAGEAVYSKHFDINEPLDVTISAGDVDLENNIAYTLKCVVSMNSGLTEESFIDFSVSWTDNIYEPNAEIGIDEDTYTAYVRPYCEDRTVSYHVVSYSNRVYTVTSEILSEVYGEPVKRAKTTTGEQVYSGVTADGTELYYCEVEESNIVDDVLLSVYRREFDGSFVELASGLDNNRGITITDPHPALDYARYRIVAITKTTGAVSYYDTPGYPIGCTSVIIQWEEDWTSFEVNEEDELVQPPWSGSLLVLPYNIDVSDSHKSDVALIEYIGRSHPVSYYGTQLGETATWSVEIDKSDKETLYALRRLAKWMGDVYVREPSGSGYWANVTVSFSQKHCAVTIPVTLDIARVEGGA